MYTCTCTLNRRTSVVSTMKPFCNFKAVDAIIVRSEERYPNLVVSPLASLFRLSRYFFCLSTTYCVGPPALQNNKREYSSCDKRSPNPSLGFALPWRAEAAQGFSINLLWKTRRRKAQKTTARRRTRIATTRMRRTLTSEIIVLPSQVVSFQPICACFGRERAARPRADAIDRDISCL